MTGPGRGLAALGVALGVALASACGGPSSAATARADAAVLAFDCPVADAEVWIDGRYQAPCGQLGGGVRLAPGAHRIEVRHDRYHAFYDTVEVAAKERRRVTVELAEVLP